MFVEVHNPNAMPTYGLQFFNYFLLITKYPMNGSPAGSSGPCVAVSEFGISQFQYLGRESNGRMPIWGYVSSDDYLAIPMIVESDFCGLVQLSPELRVQLQTENAFIGLPPELIQQFIDQGLAIRVRD